MPFSSSGFSSVDPHQRRWMLFVDGENFTIRGKEHADRHGIPLAEGPWFLPDVFLWFRGRSGTAALTNGRNVPLQVQDHAIRSFYYTSLTGDDEKLQSVRRRLHEIGFAPRVFKKTDKKKKSKGVDIALATDMLGNAHTDNFDVAVLVAGDGDYVPLLTEVKRLGKVVYVLFFEDTASGLNEELVLASDRFLDATPLLRETWTR